MSKRVALCVVVVLAGTAIEMVPSAMAGSGSVPPQCQRFPPGPRRDHCIGQVGGTAPTRVSGLRLNPATFKINLDATTPFTDKTDNKTTALSFNMSAAGRVLFRVFLKVPTTGRRVNGRCVAQRPSNRTKPRCTRTLLVPRGRFTYDASQGATNLRYQGWCQRALGRGNFRMQVEVIGNSASKSAANFKLIR